MVKVQGDVWKHFRKENIGGKITAFCQFCNKCYRNNATRMEKHLTKCAKASEGTQKLWVSKMKAKKGPAESVGRSASVSNSALPIERRSSTSSQLSEISEVLLVGTLH